VAQGAVHAEHRAQAAATKRDQQRAELAKIPVPTKSMYVDVHEQGSWANPFLSVDANWINLRVNMTDANPSTAGEDTMLRPAAARRQELPVRMSDLADALAALPAGAWRYGRVVAIAESPAANRKDRPAIRRNVEAAIRQLNDLGIVVEEWPSRYSCQAYPGLSMSK
jgi:hypothetical protein